MSISTPKATDPTLERVHTLLAPVARAHGVEVVSVRWVTEHGGRTLRVTIERRLASGAQAGQLPDGSDGVGWGVSLDDCAEVSRDLSAALDENEDDIPGHYNLEVSSPGLDRELYSAADFLRFGGRTAKVKLSKPAPDGQRLLRGSISALSGPQGAELLTMLVDGKSITVPFANVNEANLVFELEKGVKRAPAANTPRGKGPRTKTSKSSKASGAKPSTRRKASGSDNRSGA
jgi:ribosome maturation factor RimP